MSALHIVIALNYFTLVCNVTSVLVEMVNFAIVKFDNFCKNKLIVVQINIFDRKKGKKFCFLIGTINKFVLLDIQ